MVREEALQKLLPSHSSSLPTIKSRPRGGQKSPCFCICGYTMWGETGGNLPEVLTMVGHLPLYFPASFLFRSPGESPLQATA